VGLGLLVEELASSTRPHVVRTANGIDGSRTGRCDTSGSVSPTWSFPLPSTSMPSATAARIAPAGTA
jgi:hypothetical protein